MTFGGNTSIAPRLWASCGNALVLLCGALALRKQAVKRWPVQQLPTNDHCMNPLRVMDVFERIAVEQDKVSFLAGFNRSEIICFVQDLCRCQRGCLKRLQGCKPSLDQNSQLVVQCETRSGGGRICSRNQRYSGAVQLPHHLSEFGKPLLQLRELLGRSLRWSQKRFLHRERDVPAPRIGRQRRVGKGDEPPPGGECWRYDCVVFYEA